MKTTDKIARRFVLTLLALLTTTTSWAQFHGSGTSDNPYQIHTANDWATFTTLINEQNETYISACYQLMNDLTLGTEKNPLTTVVGYDRSHKFKGSFNGGYHTLYIYMNRTEDYAAPFGVAANATIENLRVVGTITTTHKWAAGIVGYTENDKNSSTHITNCISSVHIICDNIITLDDNKPYDCTHAGLVGQNESGAIIFTNCMFDGVIEDTRTGDNKKANRCAGFVAWVNVKATFTNCIMAGKIDVRPNDKKLENSSATFYRTKSIKATFKNCYFINDYTNYESSDEVIKKRQGDLAFTTVPARAISIQFNQDGKYYYVPGARLNDNTMVFSNWTFGDNNFTYSKVSGVDGINHVYKNEALTMTFVERYALQKGGYWNDKENWKYGMIPTSTGDVTLSASVTIPANAIVRVHDVDCNYNRGTVITIEKGAQFMSSNSVPAYMYKEVLPSTVEKTHAWNTIASPIDAEGFKTVENLTSSELLHNIYRYNEEKKMWEEYRNENTSYDQFENGRGYIYRTEYKGDIKYQGSTITDDVTVSLTCGKGAGMNFIGNPYSHNIYKGVAFSNDGLEPGYCYLDSNGDWIYAKDDVAIPACTAVMIQAQKAFDLVITNTMDAPAKERANGNNIWFTVKNNDYTDVAYIEFGDDFGFKKLAHYNENAPMLYISHDGEDFAATNVSADTKAIDLCFKSKTFGKYNLSFNANGDFSYLHLIDKLTGEDVDMLIEDEYSFISTSNDMADRFIVKFNYDGENSVESEGFVWQNGSDIIVNGNGNLQVFDVTGRMIHNQYVNGSETISTTLMNNGVYIFRMIGNEIKTQKVFVR